MRDKNNMKYFNITLIFLFAIIAAIFLLPPPQNTNAACNPPEDGESCCGGNEYDPETQGCCDDVVYDLETQNCCDGVVYNTNTQGCCDGVIYDLATQVCCYDEDKDKYDVFDGQCCPETITNCFYNGTITGSVESASGYLCWNPDEAVTLFATVSGHDLCGTQEVVTVNSYCSETTNYVPVCDEVSYIWEITGPTSTNGVGPDAEISTTNCGIYTATFHLDATNRPCPPPTFSLSTNLYLVKPEIEMERYIGIDLSPFPKGTNSVSGSVTVCPAIATDYSWIVASHGIFNPEPESTDTSVTVDEQGEPSSSYLEELLTVTVSPGGCTASTNFTIVEVDISLQGKDEEDEIEKGGNIPSNHDDDNIDDGLYLQDMFEEPVTNENDLVEFTITLTPKNLPTNEFVTLAGVEHMYEDNEKATNAAASYCVDRFPLTLYIDGQNGDTSVNGHSFTATHDESGAKDEVKYTYIQADVDLPLFEDQTNIFDAEIEEFSDDSYGTYLVLNDDDDTADNLNWDFQDGTDIKTHFDSRIIPLHVDWNPHDPGDDYDAKVTIDWDKIDNVAVYKELESGALEEITSPTQFDFPITPELVLYAEGKKVSDDMKDIEVTFTYTRDSAESVDKIKVSVVSVDIDGDSNHDEEITDEDDEVEANDQYPVAVMFNDDDDDADDILDNLDNIINGASDLDQMTDISIREVLPQDIPQGVVTVSGMENVRLFRLDSTIGTYVELTNTYDLWSDLPITLKAEGVTVGQDNLKVQYQYFWNNDTNGPSTTFDDELIVEVFRVDMDIDSDHTANIEGGIERSELEDAIESGGLSSGKQQHLSRKYIVVNDYYDSNSGVPGYADNQTIPGGPVANGVFVPMKFQTYGCLDDTNTIVRFSYIEGSFEEGTEENETIYTPGGSLRLWKEPQSAARNINSVVAGGDFIPANIDIPLGDIGSGEIDLYIEGFTPSDNGLGTELISVSVANDSSRANGSASAMDEIKCTIIKVDIDIDSNNDDDFDPPEQNLAEDHYEDIENDNSRPGKFMCVNNDDNDDDGIPDFADGYNLDGIIGNNDDTPAPTEKFVPVIFTIPKPIDIDTALVNITYDSSDPQMVTTDASGEYILPDGSMRIWTKKGHLQRIATKIVDGGDFIPAGTNTALSLGFTDSNRSQEWYIEAIAPSVSIADKRILFEVDPDGIVSGKQYPEFIAADAVRMTIIKVDLDGLFVYDPKLENAGNAEIKYKVDGPVSGFTPRLELTVMDGADEVACIEASPTINTEVTKSWDGKWGIKKDGTDTANKGKYADPKKYKMELKIYADAAATTAICTKEYDVHVVRLGVLEMGFLDDQELTYHKKTKDDTDNYPFTDPAIFANDVIWKMEHIDFLKPVGAGVVSRTEARKEQTPTGESYADTDNVAGCTGSELYFDADSNAVYTAGLRQVNFPPQVPTANKDVSNGIENTRYNRPAVYVRNSPIKIWFKFGTQAKSGLTLADCAVGYPIADYPIWVVANFAGGTMGGDVVDPEIGTGNAIRNINPAGGPYKLLSSATLANTVGFGTETVEFTFKYNKKGESFVDANGNGSWDTGEALINDDGNGTFDAEWEDIPGLPTNTHLIYRLGDTPTAHAQTGGRLWVKIVDFTCDWANGRSTPKQVFDEIWNTDNLWTPFTAGPQPDNANGFHGGNDPSEISRTDMWGNTPKCYSYQHDMGGSGGFDVDWLLDFNQGRCGAFAPFLLAFMGTHGLDATQQVFPLMKWRFVSNTGVVSFEKHADAVTHILNGQQPGGAVAQNGDTWYRPAGIWVDSHGQANPFYANSPYLVSFWQTRLSYNYTDHVFVKYNGRYYDASYEHTGGVSYATINEKADASVSYYYYDGKWSFDAGVGSFLDVTTTMPLDRIWMGPSGWTGLFNLLKVANDPSKDEMEEP